MSWGSWLLAPLTSLAALVVLDRRLAAGEIDVEEYYEREAALRGTGSALAGRR